MFARLGAKAILLAAAIAMAFFGVGLIGLAVATVLAPYFGAAEGYAIAGAILLVPPLSWAAIMILTRRARPSATPPSGGRDLMNSVFTALARETPWAAVAGAGLIGVVNLFLNRNKTKK
jgi:hypothetical protein